jgi:hypothetical protein
LEELTTFIDQLSVIQNFDLKDYSSLEELAASIGQLSAL